MVKQYLLQMASCTVAQEMFCTPHHTFAKEAIGPVRPAARQIIKLLRKWQCRGVSAAGGVMEVKAAQCAVLVLGIAKALRNIYPAPC